MLEDVGSKSMSLGLKYGLHLMPKGQRKRDENDLWGPPRQTNIWKDKRVRPNPTRSVFSGSQCIDKRNINGINPREIAGGIPYINSTSRKPNILVRLKLTICFSLMFLSSINIHYCILLLSTYRSTCEPNQAVEHVHHNARRINEDMAVARSRGALTKEDIGLSQLQ